MTLLIPGSLLLDIVMRSSKLMAGFVILLGLPTERRRPGSMT
jgi:hypothetical protein